MKTRRENYFASKFHLLNSQENCEEIIWSCSDSSDYENCTPNRSNDRINKAFKRKRKSSNRQKKNTNLSNLDITFIDDQKYNEKTQEFPSAPDLSNESTSPILTSQRCQNKSPVIKNKEYKPKSPVLMLKHSPKFTPKIRKRLFKCNQKNREKSVSPVLSITRNIEKCEHNNIFSLKQENQELLEESFKSKTSVALIEKVKLYFDSYFSSATSQHSITESETSKSSPINEDIEIVNSLPEEIPKLKSIEKSSSDNLSASFVPKTKKVKYKKDGLAYRLNMLLKKQNASTSLWFHERFLAANSNFILPKEEYIAYRIEKVNFKYGCFLLEAFDVDYQKFLIYINNLYVKSNNIECDSVLKLYKPYKIINFDGYKLIINVSKYECTVLKTKINLNIFPV